MSKRIFSFALTVLLLFTGICGRIGYIVFSNDYKASTSYNHYSLCIGKIKPTIYYRNGAKATNNKYRYSAVVRPNPRCIAELDKIFDSDKSAKITEELRKGYPVIVPLDKKPDVRLSYIRVYSSLYSSNNLNQICAAESNGILNFLSNDIGEKNVIYSIDAQGRLLDGDDGTVENLNYDSPEGYRISIDRAIQSVTADACKDLTSGCVVVMNVEDCSLLAVVNKPDETYMNKPFMQYAVGSVFKLVVAACALENGVDLDYNCKGSIEIGDAVFSCQNKRSHKMQNLKDALANSCNCYFVNLANYLGKQSLYDTAVELGFDDETELFDGWTVDNAIMPNLNDLESKGEVSLFGFGQGKLTVTPMQMCAFLCTVGNRGIKNEPRLFLETVNNANQKTMLSYPEPKSVLSPDACKTLLEYMNYVVTDGTGKNALTSDKKSAGKTATAQTGQFFMKNEYLNTWFAGVYPYDNPQYAIVVMKEHGKSGSQDCCPIFRTIVERLKNM
ncbi:penicillin-binding transpeptidase domain-containing protein [uncultured Eubacterium sp.]|uniref:penicillin-binding transpeptidase domain-containing protein n=1 Tax=uncultured Eubacterium sp. TaxID=165185 RepID=UPI0015ABF29A|nr:penicillin-binding transpeptidase domain-containing protein [uncultured Eubacterium sp.]